MSSPTPGSDPNYPQGGAPQGQSGWGTPQQPQGYGPPQGYGAPQGYGSPQSGYGSPQGGYGSPQGYGAPGAPQGYGAASQRPTQVTAAAIIGIVIGGLGSLFGLLSL